MREARCAIWLGLVAVLMIGACTRHQDDPPPPMFPLTTTPAPSNFTVTTSDNIVYDLSWTISDPTNLRFYVLYTLDRLNGVFVPRDTTLATSLQVNTLVPTPGAVFGVSSVSVMNVESTVVSGSAD